MKTLSLLFISAIMFTSCVTQNNTSDYGSNVIYKHKKKTRIEFSGRKETATWAEICWTELPRALRGLSSAGHHQKFLLLRLTNKY